MSCSRSPAGMVMMLVPFAGLCTTCCCMLPVLLAVGQRQQHVQWLTAAAQACWFDATEILPAGTTVCHTDGATLAYVQSAGALITGRGGSGWQAVSSGVL